MKNLYRFTLATAASVMLAGCVVPVAGPSVGVSASVGVPPADYVVGGAPVYYPAEPNVAYYPVYVDFPGSCFCVMPVRYYGGAWVTVGGGFVHRGPWQFRHPPAGPRDQWLRSGGRVNGQIPHRGRYEHQPGRQFQGNYPNRPGYPGRQQLPANAGPAQQQPGNSGLGHAYGRRGRDGQLQQVNQPGNQGQGHAYGRRGRDGQGQQVMPPGQRAQQWQQGNARRDNARPANRPARADGDRRPGQQ